MNQVTQIPDNTNGIVVPKQHIEAHLIDAHDTYILAARATFKTSLGGSLFLLRRVFEMPKSTGACVGISFNNLYENTVPPVKAFLLSKGFVEDVHFTICKPPPASWPKPLLGIVDKSYKNTMTWYNGTVMQFISLRRRASANGVSAQWGLFDEAKFMDESVLVEEIFAIFRGNEKYFGKCGGYLAKCFMTDKSADPAHIKWLLKKRELVDHNKKDLVLRLANHLQELKLQYNTATKTGKYLLRPQIHAIETRLATLRSSLVNVVEISIDDVRPILGEMFYQDKKRNTPEHEFRVVYENKDPDRPGDPFYPAWDKDKLCYDIKDDIDTNKPLIIASDYQHSIAPIPVAQISELPGSDITSLNYVDEVYTLKGEGGLRKAVSKFCKRFQNHLFKHVYYVFDHTSVGERQDAETFSTIVIDELEKNDWNVWPIYTGQAPDHYQKHTDTIDWMKHEHEEDLAIRINVRCEKMIMSITGAAAKIINKQTKKDKSGELNKKLDQSETTHFSDAFDMINDAVLKQKLITEIVSATPFTFK